MHGGRRGGACTWGIRAPWSGEAMELISILEGSAAQRTLAALASAADVGCSVRGPNGQVLWRTGAPDEWADACREAEQRKLCPHLRASGGFDRPRCQTANVRLPSPDGEPLVLQVCRPVNAFAEGRYDLGPIVRSLAQCFEHLGEDARERAAREGEFEALAQEVALLHELPDIACQCNAEESTADLIVRRATEALMSDGAVLAVRADPAHELHPLAWAGVEIAEVRAYCAGLAALGDSADAGCQEIVLPADAHGGRWLLNRIGEAGRSQGLLAVRRAPEALPFGERDRRLLTAMARHAHLGFARQTHESELRRNCLNWVNALVTTIDAKDCYTKGHSERVAVLARRTGAALGLDDSTQQFLQTAGLIHDLGKIALNTETLRKATPLTDPEWIEVRSHPQWSADIISWLPQLADLRAAALHHHERYDGGGYPGRLRGDEIPLPARLLAVGDAYDAMTTNRPYRKAMSSAQAQAELMAHRGTQFCPETVDAFIGVLEARKSALDFM